MHICVTSDALCRERRTAETFHFERVLCAQEQALKVFIPDGRETKLKRCSLMSRYLNGAGMGFFPAAAKAAANGEVWAGDQSAVAEYKTMERLVGARCKDKGVGCTVIRAGTLKGGACGDATVGGDGEPSFLNPLFYNYGQQDVVNWRLLYDCAALGVELSKGDTLPGPGFKAALTATSPEGGDGDSHRWRPPHCVRSWRPPCRLVFSRLCLLSCSSLDLRDFSLACILTSNRPRVNLE